LAIVFVLLAIPILLLLFGLMTGSIQAGRNILDYSFILVAIAYILPTTLIIGLPVCLVLLFFRQYYWWQYTLTGLVGGLAIPAFSAGTSEFYLYPIFGIYGLFTTWVLWAIAVRPWKRDQVDLDKADNTRVRDTIV
jgi:hypothetical protein